MKVNIKKTSTLTYPTLQKRFIIYTYINDFCVVLQQICIPGTARKRRRWHLRARGLLTRILASFCICNTETKV